MAEPISVFLSYRRSDTPYAAGRLADRLGERFKLFMDIDIAPGLHFGRALTEAVEGCDVMVVLIGPSWLSAVEEDGSRRLDNPRDWVVQEIEAALAREVTVIPVLVDGARMPTPDQLPAPLEALAFRQALSLRHESFATDITTLIGAVDRAAPGGPDAAPDRPQGRGADGRGLAAAEGETRRAGGHAAGGPRAAGPPDRRRGELPDHGHLVPPAGRPGRSGRQPGAVGDHHRAGRGLSAGDVVEHPQSGR